MADRYDRAGRIDRAVEQAQRGTPAAPSARKGRSRLSPAELYQIEAENKGFDVSAAKLERLRKAQSNPGNGGG